MTRKKLSLVYITNDSERRTSFRKRKKGLIKKVSELSALCDVDACAIIYSPFDPEPEVWPSPAEAQPVLDRFKRLSEVEKSTKTVNQESFTRQRIKKSEKQLRRLQKENKRREMESFMFQCLAGYAGLDQFDVRDAAEMGRVVDQALRDIQSRMDALKINGCDDLRVLPAADVEEVVAVTGGENVEGYLLNHVVESANGPGGGGLGWDLGC